MAVCGLESEAINFSKLFDLLQGRGRKRRLALKGVQHDSLQQIAEREVLQLGQSLEHLEQAFLHADAGLDAFDDEATMFCHGSNVPKYHDKYNKATWKARPKVISKCPYSGGRARTVPSLKGLGLISPLSTQR